MPVLEFYSTDFCPFAQRTWIALLEKEKDPNHPKLFNYREINFYNRDLPETQEFLKIHNTVPCGVYGDKQLRESMDMCYWADEEFPHNPLQPASDEGKAKMKAIIDKYTSGEYSLISHFFAALTSEEKEAAHQSLAKLESSYLELDKELASSGGPYLLGSQFSLADIALYPFIERQFIILPHHKQWTFPSSGKIQHVRRWKSACEQRASVRITTADRLPRSMAVQPFGKVKRQDYMVELYAMYAYGVRNEVREQLRHAPPGVSTVNIPAAIEAKHAKAQAAARRRCVMKSVGMAAAVAAGVTALSYLYKCVQSKQTPTQTTIHTRR